jgi:hypothetical protein
MDYDSKGILVFNLKYEHANFNVFYIWIEPGDHILSNYRHKITKYTYLNELIRDVPYSLKSPRNSECKLAHIYGMNKGKVFMSCVLYTNGYVNVNECIW